MLFPTLATFLIVWSCRLKGLQKPVSLSVDYTMEIRPKKPEMAVHGNTSIPSEKGRICCYSKKRKKLCSLQGKMTALGIFFYLWQD